MAYKRALNSVINNYYKMQKEQAIQDNIDMVAEYNDEIEDGVREYEEMLANTVLVEFNPDKYYKKFYKNTPIDEYVPLVKETEKSIKKRTGLMKQNKLLEKLNPNRTNKRLEHNIMFQIEMDRVDEEYNKNEKANREKYDKYVEKTNNEDLKHNKIIYQRKENYYKDNQDEILSIFECSGKKFNFDGGCMKYIGFSYENRTASLDIEFLNPDNELSKIKGYKYLKTKWEMKEIYYTNTELENLYELMVFNSMLSAVSKVWYYFKRNIDSFIVNAYVNKLNPAVGKMENYYFVSAKLQKGDIPFDRLELLDSKCFFDSKHAKYKLPLTSIKKIDPFEFNGKKMMDVIDDDIDGFDFENLTKELLESNGFDNVKVTQASGDYGADVIALKDGIKYAIQCKKYSSKVGVKSVQEIIAAKSMYKCHVGVVLTNNYFTPSAENLAESNGILLWDKDKLEEFIENAGMNKGLNDVDVSVDNEEYDDRIEE